MSNRGQKRDFGRGRPRIAPRQTVYIICEGEKTEFFYLKAIVRERRLRTVKVDIDPGRRSGSDPQSLLQYAKAKRIDGGYNEVWCAFDGDGRAYADEVLAKAKRKPIVAVAFSNPCFELWFFLHYDYSTGACDQGVMVDRLKQHITDYTKSKDVFADLPDRSRAVQRASDLRKHHLESGNKLTENPSTSVDMLVELLYSLEDPR